MPGQDQIVRFVNPDCQAEGHHLGHQGAARGTARRRLASASPVLSPERAPTAAVIDFVFWQSATFNQYAKVVFADCDGVCVWAVPYRVFSFVRASGFDSGSIRERWAPP